MNAAILFEPDGYLLTGPKLMGRQSAGHGFLRAAVAGRGDQPVIAYTPFQASAESFQRAVAEIDPAAPTRWIPGSRLDQLAQVGVLYRPDQVLGPLARQRLRMNPAAYSLCGVTHTLASHTTLDSIAQLPLEPVMAWDALVCTSAAALSVVNTVLDYRADYQRWRTGRPDSGERPLLPVIPLGVHSGDFAFTDADRAEARRELGLEPGTVAVLVAGRLSMNGKAHPYAMLQALQQVAEETGDAVALILAGQAFNAAIDRVFRTAIAAFCPAVQIVFVDGKDPDAYRRSWAAGDIFMSLADSIQETFGLTPLEAMAAGLPALVSDWNGYKDTVRDGIDGFRIPTWAPPPGVGDRIAHDYEIGASRLEEYFGQANTAVAVDMTALVARLRDLVSDPALRRKLGASGQARARSTFDWTSVFKSYQALWGQQTAIRRKALADPTTRGWLAQAPRAGPEHMGPFDTFAAYATHHVGPQTRVRRTRDITPEGYRERLNAPILAYSAVAPEIADRVFAALDAGPATVEQLSLATGLTVAQLAEIVARLAKTDLVALSEEPGA